MTKWVIVGHLTAVFLSCPLGIVASAQGYPELLAQSDGNAPLAAMLEQVCGGFVDMNAAMLQRRESDEEALARGDRSVLCAQLALYLQDSDAPVIAPLPASDGSRYSNIVSTALALLARPDADSAVAEMFGLVINGEAKIPQAALVANALRHHPGPSDSPAVGAVDIGCIYVALPLDSLGLADSCARRGLAAGRDSTYNLLALSRIAGLLGDTSRAVATLESAIQAAHSPLADSHGAKLECWCSTGRGSLEGDCGILSFQGLRLVAWICSCSNQGTRCDWSEP